VDQGIVMTGTVTGTAGVLLYSSDRTRVMRVPSPDGSSVIRKEALGPGGVTRLRHEAEVVRRLAGVHGVPQLLEADTRAGAIVLADSGGRALSQLVTGSGGDPVWVARFACRLAAVVAEVHRAGVVHKDINPANVLVRAEVDQPVLIDFDLATTFAAERPQFTHHSQIVGTLAYLAPEQTGRTGRAVDQRADLYGLGATMYELATGRPPFHELRDDPLGLVHAHLATVPVAPQDVNPAVPPFLSAIIMRLLAKEPDRRYQSAEGLVHDLTLLLGPRDAVDRTAFARTVFVLGARDFPARLSPPSRLVGRDGEISRLHEAYRQVRGGRPGAGALLVAGAPGVGKSALLDELRPLVTADGGWFVTGKFDQFRQDAAADGVRQALTALGRLLLAESEADLAHHRERLLAGLGPNAGLVAVGFAEFAALLDVPPQQPRGGRDEIAARMVRAGVELLAAVASPQRPVVMVLDDLQWAPAFPIRFVDAVLTDPRLDGVLLVGAYRDGEVDETHALTAMLSRWQRLEVAEAPLRLVNLPPAEVSVLLGEMLRLAPDQATGLAEALGARTGGNPYDTVELVNALRRDGILVPDTDGWRWDSGAIRTFIGAGDVTGLITARIDQLPAATADLVHTLACLGGDVDQALLATAADLTQDDVREHLAPALEDGLLLAVNGGPDEPYAAVRFCHDRVQHAAYTRAINQAGSRHLTLARRLAREYPALAGEQYLRAVDDVADPEEARHAAALLLAAARNIRPVNPATAGECLDAAIAVLSRTGAAEDELTAALRKDLLKERHGVLISSGRLDEADECYAAIVACEHDPVALADATDRQVAGLTGRTKVAEALRLGTDVLARLGLVAPDDLAGAVQEGLDRIISWIDHDAPGDDARADVTDPRLVAVGTLIARLSTPAHMTDPLRSAWLTTQSQRLWAEHGPAETLLSGTVGLSAVLIGFRGDYRRGHDVARAVFSCARAHGYHLAQPVAAVALASCYHWRHPLEEAGVLAREAREGLLHLGQVHYAGVTYAMTVCSALETAGHLDVAAEENDAGAAYAARSVNKSIGSGTMAIGQFIRAMRGETGVAGRFTDEEFDEARYRDIVELDVTGVFLHCFRALTAAIFGDTAALREYAAAAMACVAAFPAMYVVALAHLVQALALAERLRSEPLTGAEREAVSAELDGCREWLAARAADAPVNFSHLVRLVDAERAWASGAEWAAAREFDAAQHEVSGRSRPWHRAFILERAAAFHLAHGLGHTGYRLLAEARHAWQAWGATGKVRELDRVYPFLRTDHPGTSTGGGTGLSFGRSLGASMVASAEGIDLLAVLKASQALSTETNLDRLRERVVAVLTAMTGATGVHLALWNDDTRQWQLTTAAGAGLTVGSSGADAVPWKAFRYAERTGEPLRVDDATTDDRFARDPYLGGLDVCSLLVVPILAHGKPRAMLVLENRLTRGAFSPDRLDAVLLIAGQLAVSLDNALAERFRSLVQRSADLTLVTDRDGLVSYASVAATDLVGIDPTALTARPLADLLHPDDADDLLELVRHCHDVRTSPCRLVHADGTERWVEATITDLTGDPAVRGVMLHLRDITERHRLETELRHAQKLESIGHLSAGIAHEINTPIQFIADNLTFLTDAFGELSTVLRPLPTAVTARDPAQDLAQDSDAADAGVDVDFLLAEIPQALADTIDGTTRVATIVRAMKALGHPGSEGKAEADLSEAIRNTLIVAANEIRPVADVVTDLADLPPLWCNIGDINQVLLGLVVNAAHAIADKTTGPPGGTDERGILTIRTERDGHDVVIHIQDTGTGIPADIADRVFDQFFTTKPVGTGTGQGLALAHTLIHDHHDGSLTFTTTPGEGTTFTIRIPNRPPN
jgi:PAS domain S-box-containing protein